MKSNVLIICFKFKKFPMFVKNSSSFLKENLLFLIFFFLWWFEKGFWICRCNVHLLGPNNQISFHSISIFTISIILWFNFTYPGKKVNYNFFKFFKIAKQKKDTYSNFNAILYRFNAARLLFLTWRDTYLALNVSTIALAVWSISFCAKPRRRWDLLTAKDVICPCGSSSNSSSIFAVNNQYGFDFKIGHNLKEKK